MVFDLAYIGYIGYFHTSHMHIYNDTVNLTGYPGVCARVGYPGGCAGAGYIGGCAGAGYPDGCAATIYSGGVQLQDILAGVQVCVLIWKLILDRPVPCQCKHGFKFRIDGNNKVYLNVSTFGRYP